MLGCFFLPNAFTPNEYGTNNAFGIIKCGAVREFGFPVYSSWGEKVFYTTNPRKKWNRLYKGLPQSEGAYIYDIKAKTYCEGAIRRGAVLLIK